MKRPALLSLLIFVILLGLTLLMVHQQSLIVREDEEWELQIELSDIKERFSAVLNENIAAAQTLAIFYSQGGERKKFDAVARELIRNHKYLDLIGLTDKFVVKEVYPVEGNEVVIGYDLLSDTLMRKELLSALAKKELKFAGPYKMLDNRGMAIAGRVPIYVGDELKGLSVVVTRLTTIKRFLDAIVARDKKFVYQLSRVNPVTNRVEYFFQDSDLRTNRVKTTYIPEGEWQLHVAYAPGYKPHNNMSLILALGILLSASIAVYVYSKAMQKRTLEKTVALKTHQLAERVKELSTIYDLNKIFIDPEQNEDDVLGKVVTILPPGWQYPDICRAKVSFEGKDYVTPGYVDTVSKQREDFRLADGRSGSIEIVYLREVRQEAEGPFLKEERDLINSIARSLEIFLNKLAQENERKKIHRDLELALSLTRATIESTADGILVVDTSGRISDYNTQYLKLWGAPDDIIKTRDAFKVLAYAKKQVVNPEEFESRIRELYTHPEQESLDTLYFVDGRVFERHTKPQRAEKEIVGRVWNFRDITQQKRSEAEIKQLNADLEERVKRRTMEVDKLNQQLKANVQSLEIANRELESFSYSVSHDLRAPLRSINGFATLLEQKAKNLDEQSVKFLKIITDSAQKMNQLIEDLLAFSRVGKNELEKADVDMNALLQEVLNEVNVRERNAQTELIVAELPPANGDRNLLKQVFVNLISNAAKYSSTKEKPTIEVGAYMEGDEQVYFVKDNGVGFDMKYYEKLFKVFQRLHSAEDFEGVGVGLAIVQRIVAKHGGRVWAEAEEGVGATFYFALPAMDAEEKEQQSKGSTSAV